MERCENCKFWLGPDAARESFSGRMGDCVKKAPSVFAHKNPANGGDVIFYANPMTSASYWCGDFLLAPNREILP